MRLKRSSSVGATASEKMLNPAGRTALDTASTPALFSTSTTSVVPGVGTGQRHQWLLTLGRIGDDLVVEPPAGTIG